MGNQRSTFRPVLLLFHLLPRSPNIRSEATVSTLVRSVAAVHKYAEVHTVELCNRFDLRTRHSAVIFVSFGRQTTPRYGSCYCTAHTL